MDSFLLPVLVDKLNYLCMVADWDHALDKAHRLQVDYHQEEEHMAAVLMMVDNRVLDGMMGTGDSYWVMLLLEAHSLNWVDNLVVVVRGWVGRNLGLVDHNHLVEDNLQVLLGIDLDIDSGDKVFGHRIVLGVLVVKKLLKVDDMVAVAHQEHPILYWLGGLVEHCLLLIDVEAAVLLECSG